MRTPVVVRASGAEALGEALRAWLMEAARATGNGVVLLAVGDSTLPLYTSLPSDDPAWSGKRILPLDELVPPPNGPSFRSRLGDALPPGLRARLSALEGEPGAIAIAVLGLGPDGHIAFNQPGSDERTVTRIVELIPENRARIGEAAPRALTVGVATILRAERVALVASGEDKRAALQRVLDGPEGADVPASFLRRHPEVTIFVDPSAC